MKVSVSLSEDDVAFLDSYARTEGIRSRSAVLHQAVALLRASKLESAYAEAWANWDSSDEGDAWDSTIADGLDG